MIIPSINVKPNSTIFTINIVVIFENFKLKFQFQNSDWNNGKLVLFLLDLMAGDEPISVLTLKMLFIFERQLKKRGGELRGDFGWRFGGDGS